MNRQYEFVVLGISQPASSSTSHSKSKESKKTSSSSKYNNISIEHDHLIFTRFHTKMTSVKFRISTGEGTSPGDTSRFHSFISH